METCHETRAISETSYRILKVINYVTIIALAIFFSLLCILNVVVGGVVMGGVLQDGNKIAGLNISIFLFAGVLFAASNIILSILINVLGYKLNITLQQSITKMTEYVKNDVIPDQQKQHTIHIKKFALRRVRIIHVGMTISLLIQAFSFIIIPLNFASIYTGLAFFFLMNSGVAVFIVLLLLINTPMNNVQQHFRKSDTPTTTLPDSPVVSSK